MAQYLPRVIDDQLDQMLHELPAVSIDGAKGVGKTETAARRVSSEIRLDDEDEAALVAADRRRLERLTPPVLVDEWQRYPQIWDRVRRAVDQDPSPGRFVLTGSASPAEQSTHSGAARIVPVRMRPMSLAERALLAPTVSLADLLRGGRPDVGGESALQLETYAEEITRSGFPGIRGYSTLGRYDALEGYIQLIVEREFPEQGITVRRPESLRQWMAAYAAASATSASYNTILDAATPGMSDKPTKVTTLAHRDVLARLWVLEPLPAWLPARNHLARLGQAPKHHLCDPALASHILGMNADALLTQTDAGPPIPRDGPLLGSLFESLVTLSVRVYAQLARASVHHLRTQGGAREIDLIVRRSDDRIVAVEVKLSPVVDDADVKHLLWLRDQIGPDLLDMAVITTGRAAYRRPDGVAVIPAPLLGP